MAVCKALWRKSTTDRKEFFKSQAVCYTCVEPYIKTFSHSDFNLKNFSFHCPGSTGRLFIINNNKLVLSLLLQDKGKATKLVQEGKTMSLLHSVQSVYRCQVRAVASKICGTTDHSQPSVPPRPNSHLQTRSMPLFNWILG